MATTSRLCSDEELQKARDDLRELLARSPNPDELKCDATAAEEKGKKHEARQKKMKTYILPKEEVERILSKQCGPPRACENMHKVAREDGETYGYLGTLATASCTIIKEQNDIIRAAQEEMRHQIETKGYYTYEATDDEEDDNGGEFEYQHGLRVRGRRGRRRPGIVKHARGGINL